MKKMKLFVAMVLLLTSTITAFANDYALLETYPLLDEMKSAKRQKVVLDNMYTVIIENNYNSQEQLTKLKSQFATALNSILKGTKVTIIRNKIEELKLQWEQNNHLLDAAVNNKMYKEEAFRTLSQLSETLSSINSLYAQSYAKYRQNSVMKSLVSSYIRAQQNSVMKSLVSSYIKEQQNSETRYAFNNLK